MSRTGFSFNDLNLLATYLSYHPHFIPTLSQVFLSLATDHPNHPVQAWQSHYNLRKQSIHQKVIKIHIDQVNKLVHLLATLPTPITEIDLHNSFLNLSSIVSVFLSTVYTVYTVYTNNPSICLASKNDPVYPSMKHSPEAWNALHTLKQDVINDQLKAIIPLVRSASNSASLPPFNPSATVTTTATATAKKRKQPREHQPQAVTETITLPDTSFPPSPIASTSKLPPSPSIVASTSKLSQPSMQFATVPPATSEKASTAATSKHYRSIPLPHPLALAQIPAPSPPAQASAPSAPAPVPILTPVQEPSSIPESSLSIIPATLTSPLVPSQPLASSSNLPPPLSPTVAKSKKALEKEPELPTEAGGEELQMNDGVAVVEEKRASGESYPKFDYAEDKFMCRKLAEGELKRWRRDDVWNYLAVQVCLLSSHSFL